MNALEQAKQAQQYDYLMKGSLTTSPEQAWEWRHNMMRDAVEGWPATAKALLELAAAAQAAVDMLDTTWVYCPGCECYPAKGEHWPECKVYRLTAVLEKL